jgi:HEAT repeat protein
MRRNYSTDDDERVRRAALLAALEAEDEQDTDELLEVARLDPDPLSRSRAYQVLGRIGGKRVSQALLDRFVDADEQLRLAIVDAWSASGLYAKGGRRQLARLLTHDRGFDALHAASILAREQNETLRNRGVNRLLYFTQEGTTEERRMAIRLLPGGVKGTVMRLKELTKSEDREVAVIAWARLLGESDHREEAQATLLEWARENTSVGLQARSALSTTGDKRVLPFMQQQMQSQSPEARPLAGAALVRLGAYRELAPLLADEAADVRRAVACLAIAREPLPVEPM